jgi:nitroreductase
MDVLEAIEKRMSIRKFLDKEVEDEKIKQLIEAARMAPSGNNSQPWHFYVVKKGEVTEKLKQADIFHQKLVYDAPVIIACSTDVGAYKKHVDGWDDSNEKRAIRDLSIASGFITLMATELGLGSCFIGWLKKEEIKKVLNIPEQYMVPYVILIGYADEDPDRRTRKSLADIMEVK